MLVFASLIECLVCVYSEEITYSIYLMRATTLRVSAEKVSPKVSSEYKLLPQPPSCFYFRTLPNLVFIG